MKGRLQRAAAFLAGLLVALVAAPTPGDAAADRAGLSRLEARAKAFYETVVRGQRERAAEEWPGLEADLAAFVTRLRDDLDRQRDEVAERDGDLEELYRSPRWREPEIASLVATYHLAWVRYQGAQLVTDAAKKKVLLQQAVEGFSQFLMVNEVPEIYAESLYGRGLAFLDLGDYPKAREDLRQASEIGQVSGRAKAALAEVDRRARGGKPGSAQPAEDDPEVLLARLGEFLPRAAAGDAATERDATPLARGLAARGGTWPARVERTVAERLGSGTPASVRSSWGLFLLGQLAVDRKACAEVAPLVEAGAAVSDAGRTRWRPELLFLDAGCTLNAGRQREAAERFARLGQEFPEAPRAREAAYFRFRALDVARGTDAALTQAYEESLRTYVERFPKADGSGEARFLLGELRRSRGECPQAEAAYTAVTGPFADRARLGILECRVGRLAAAADGGTSEERRAVVAELRAFATATPDKSLAARATLLGALVAAGSTPPDEATVVALLDGWEARFPDAKNLAPQAIQLRLVARVATGDLGGAERDLAAFLATREPGPERRKTLSRLARDLQTHAERAPDGGATLTLARQVQVALVAETGDPRDRLVLAELTLRAGDAGGARPLFEEVLAADPGSAEALRGAARAAAAAGDREAALGYWRRVLDASPPGGTAWYEARLAQVTLLASDGRRAQACELIRSSRGRATSAGGDQLEARLRTLEADICQ